MELRTGCASDAAALADIETACFPAAEAAAAAQIAARLNVYANHFYVLWDGARPVAFINGMTTDEPDLRGVVLTCKEKLVPYYAKFGFVDEGVSQSAHGGVVWHQMRRTF